MHVSFKCAEGPRLRAICGAIMHGLFRWRGSIRTNHGLTPGVVWMGGGGKGTRRGSRWLFPLCIPEFIITILTCYALRSCFHHFSAAHGRLKCGARGEIEPPLRQLFCDVHSRSCSSKIRVFICRGKGDGVLRTANPQKIYLQPNPEALDSLTVLS